MDEEPAAAARAAQPKPSRRHRLAHWLVALGALTLVRCSSSSGSPGPDAHVSSALACNAAAYCTSWWIVGNQVDQLPAASGGTIASGTYALVDVLAVETSFRAQLRQVMLVDGNNYRNTDVGGSGTLSTSGNHVTFTEARVCGSKGEDLGASTAPATTYEYTVDGSSLIVFNETNYSFKGKTIRVGLVYLKSTGDLCDPVGVATCTLGERCFCASASNAMLLASQCGG